MFKDLQNQKIVIAGGTQDIDLVIARTPAELSANVTVSGRDRKNQKLLVYLIQS